MGRDLWRIELSAAIPYAPLLMFSAVVILQLIASE